MVSETAPAPLLPAEEVLLACGNCKSRSRSEDDPVLRKVCGVCGFPRVFLTAEDAALAAKTSKTALADAKRSKVVAAGARLASVGVFASALVAGALGGLLLGPAPAAGIVLLVVMAALVFGALLLRRRGNRAESAATAAVSTALEEGARALVDEAVAPVTTDALAARLGVDTAEAERLLTIATALGRARIAVDAAGRVEAVPSSFREVSEELADPDEGANAPQKATTP